MPHDCVEEFMVCMRLHVPEGICEVVSKVRVQILMCRYWHVFVFCFETLSQFAIVN